MGFEGVFDFRVCFTNKTTGTLDCKYNEHMDLSDALTGLITWTCLILCIALWLVVVGSFVRHTKGAFWRIPFQSGEYLQFSFTVRQQSPYRYVSGAIAVGAVFAVFCLFVQGMAMGGEELVQYMLETQMSTMVVVILSGRAFFAPTKPKFNFKHADFAGIRFRRASFWQTNGSFALLFGSALIQASRSRQFRRRLMDKLEQPEDWEHVLNVCVQESTTTLDKIAV